MLATICALLAAQAGIAAATAVPAPHSQSMTKRQSAGGSCSSTEFATITTVGGSGGTAFCESSWGTSYVPVTNITMWSNDEEVTGLQLTYSDGSQSAVIGAKASVKASTVGVVYGSNDVWKRVSMYTVSGEHVRHLLLEASNGDTINGGENVASDPNLSRYDQDVGSGLLFGIKGTVASNGILSSLGFIFLESPISEIAITNIQFPNGPVGTGDDIYPTDAGTAYFDNSKSQVNVTYQYNSQLTQTQSYMFAQAYANTFSTMEAISFNFGLKILIISIGGSETTTYTWSTTTTDTTTSTFTDSTQVQYNAAVTLGPGQTATCSTVAGQGSGKFPYTSTVTVTLKNGHSYSFPQSGVLTVSSLSQGVVQCSNGTVQN